MKESAVENKLVRGVRYRGGRAYKFVSPGNSGVPDRMCILPGGRIIFVELKTDTGHLTPLQIENHRHLRELGCDVRTLYGSKDVEEFLDEI